MGRMVPLIQKEYKEHHYEIVKIQAAYGHVKRYTGGESEVGTQVMHGGFSILRDEEDPGLPSLSTPKDTISSGGEPWYQYFNVVAILCAAKMPPNCFPVVLNCLRVATKSLFTHSL